MMRCLWLLFADEFQSINSAALTEGRDEVGAAKTAGLAWDGDVVVFLLVLLVGGHG